MNTENLSTLIAALEKLPPEKFNMENWFTDKYGFNAIAKRDEFGVTSVENCGTSACLAGWTNIVRGAAQWICPTEERVWLGLTYEQAYQLFKPNGCFSRPEDFSLARAIDVLRHLRATDEVRWDLFPAENYCGERDPTSALYTTL